MGKPIAFRNTGKKLEQDFAEFMKTELNFEKTELRVPISGKVSSRSYECDIHGELHDSTMLFFKRAGFVILTLCILAAFIPNDFGFVQDFFESVMKEINPSLVDSALVITGIAAVILGIWADNSFIKHAWVECKDTKTKVKRAMIQKTQSSVDDVSASEENSWTPKLIIFVSGSGFDHDALKFAREYDFICYQRSGDGFELVE